MIEGVVKTPLKQFKDERGSVMHMLRSTDTHFEQFGEIYFSWIYEGAVKAWSKHLKMKLNYAVPIGSVNVVLYDDRLQSSTFGELNEFYMNADDYYLLTIPSGVWYGFQSVDKMSSMVVNCATLPHDVNEIKKINFDDSSIPYKWRVKNA